MSRRKCKQCREWFNPFRSNQSVCSAACAYEYAKAKEWKKRKKVLKEKVKTKSDHLKEAQYYFNKYIRMRDEGKGCISCGKHNEKFDAGHYRSVGSHPQLRFNEINVHGQCRHCNSFLSGNLIEYRKNLIKRIGVDMVEWLEQEHEPRRLTVDEIKALKKKYQNLCNNQSK